MKRSLLLLTCLIWIVPSLCAEEINEYVFNPKRGYGALKGEFVDDGLLIRNSDAGVDTLLSLPSTENVGRIEINIDPFPVNSVRNKFSISAYPCWQLLLSGDEENFAEVSFKLSGHNDNLNDIDSVEIEISTNNGRWKKSWPDKKGISLHDFHFELVVDDSGLLLKVDTEPELVVEAPVSKNSFNLIAIRNLCTGSGGAIKIRRAKVSAELSDIALATEWTEESLSERFERSRDPLEGIWRYYDSTLEQSLLKLGGEYKLAIVKGEDGYDIIYLDGARTNSGKWKSGMRKGRLKKTDFNGIFDGEWVSSSRKVMKRNIRVQTEEFAQILLFSFPYQASAVRFRKVINGKRD